MGENNSRGNGKIIKFPSKADMEREYLEPPAHTSKGLSTAPPEPPPAPPKQKAPEKRSVADRVLMLKKSSTFVRGIILALPDWVTPNAVTWFRMLLIVPISWWLRHGSYWAALACAAVAIGLDFVDGAIASIRKMESESGAFLDPLADKVLICGIILSLTDKLPPLISLLGYLVLTIALGLTALRILKLARKRRGLEAVPGANIAAGKAGKLKMWAETVSVLLIITGFAVASPWLVWSGGVALLGALILAGWSFLSQLGSYRT